MKLRMHSPALVAVALVALCAATAAAAPSIDAAFQRGGPFGDVRIDARNCATPEPGLAETEAVRAAVQRYIDEYGVQAVGGQIKVAFHVISGRNNEGNIPQSQIDAQIAALNSGFSGTGYTFVLATVTRTNNRTWFTMTPGSSKESSAKNSLAIDPARRLNFYTCKPGQNLLGWATFPWSYAETSKLHGVVVHYGSVPGGYLTAFNEGDTGTHEVGHYLGLYHTFQGGCASPGDYVDDTPYEASPYYGCGNDRDSCPSSPGLDPIHNFMDYSDDVCLTHFTAGQDARMDVMVPQYKPSLLNAPIAQEVRHDGEDPSVSRPAAHGLEVSFRGASPNPFRGDTDLRFALPRGEHVSVRVYSITGQLLRTLWDGEMAAGEHTLRLDGAGLAPGMYYAQVRTGAQTLARTLVKVN